jgi:hypothetical protein
MRKQGSSTRRKSPRGRANGDERGISKIRPQTGATVPRRNSCHGWRHGPGVAGRNELPLTLNHALVIWEWEFTASSAIFSFPSEFLAGFSAAAGTALINSVGNLGRFAGPIAIGALANGTGGIYRGLALAGASPTRGKGAPSRDPPRRRAILALFSRREWITAQPEVIPEGPIASLLAACRRYARNPDGALSACWPCPLPFGHASDRTTVVSSRTYRIAALTIRCQSNIFCA